MSDYDIPAQHDQQPRAAEPQGQPAPDTVGSPPASGPEGGASESAGVPAGEAPTKRPARKRAAKKAQAEPAAEPAADGQPSGSGQTLTPDLPPDGQPAPTARRRARKTATSAADGTQPTAEATAGTAATEESGPQPAKKAARKRSARKSGETPPTSAEPSDGPLVPEVGLAAPSAGGDADRPASPTIPAVAVPALFQAPDPTLATVPRRRTRKTAAAGDEAAVTPEETPESPTPDTGGRQPRARAGGRSAGSAQSPLQTDAVAGDAAAATQDPSEPDEEPTGGRRRRRRGGRRHKRAGGDEPGSESDEGQETASPATDRSTVAEPDQQAGAAPDTSTTASVDEGEPADEATSGDGEDGDATTRRRRRRRRRKGEPTEGGPDDPEDTVVRVREPRSAADQVTALEGSTRLQAKKQRRRENRDAGKRRPSILTESEFLARRESVERVMAVRQRGELTQIAVIEDGVLVEHYVSQAAQTSQIGNIHLGRVQNVLPSMEAAFVDIGKGRNAILYAGEVDWVALGLNGQPKKIEAALKSGQTVLVQVSKDPVGQKGARLTSQISLAGRYVVFVPGGGMSGISRKLPDTERSRLKEILRGLVPEGASVVVRTAAEGATEDELRNDVERLQAQWTQIEAQVGKGQAPKTLYVEPDLLLKVVRDLFNSDFARLEVSGPDAGTEVLEYVAAVAPHLGDRVHRAADDEDVFARYDVDDQIAKALQRKVWLPSGGSLVIDRTEAMTVVDVNTGKFTGSGGSLEETVTKNNLEAAEEIVRQLRLRDLGGIVVIDFIDMVLEANRELVLRRLVECLGRDRTKHQVAEVTSLGLVQMTRKRIGIGLLEAFSEPCPHCAGRGLVIHDHPRADTGRNADDDQDNGRSESRSGRNGRKRSDPKPTPAPAVPHGPNPAEIIAAAAARSRSAEHPEDGPDPDGDAVDPGSARRPDDGDLLELDLSRPAETAPPTADADATATPGTESVADASAAAGVDGSTVDPAPDAGPPDDSGPDASAADGATSTHEFDAATSSDSIHADDGHPGDSTTTSSDQVVEAAAVDAAGHAFGGPDAAPVDVADAGAPSGIPADARWNGEPEPGTQGITVTEAQSESGSAAGDGDAADGATADGDRATGDASDPQRTASDQLNGTSRPRRRRGRRGGRSRRDEAPTADPLADGSDPSDFEPADLSRADA